jgi:two-component system sensor histidine kinase/response regulator
MNLRTRGILLSILPLAITLVLVIPEVAVQVNSSQAVQRASRSDFMSEVADGVEENSLDLALETRNAMRGVPGALLEFAQTKNAIDDNVNHLRTLSAGDPSTERAAERVAAAVSTFTQIGNSVIREAQQHTFDRAFASPNGRAFGQAAVAVRASLRTYDDIEHSDVLTSLAALQDLWKSSLLLLALVIGGLALTSAAVAYYSGRVVDTIINLGRTAERYRRGEPLGIPSPRHDEIGLLDAAIHEFAAAKRQRESELTRYRLLADITHDIILFVDRNDLTIIDANVAALHAYGYTDLVGRSMALLHAADDPLNIDNEMIALSDRPEGLSYEGSHRRFDGTIFPVEVHARTAEVDGRLTIVKTIRDISERRRADEQVSIALDHALEASRLKSEFVATMSHEIRTPMHGVIGMSELLLETQLMPQQREYAATVKESAQALLAIIDDILDFSKLEANKIELEVVPFDPAQLVTSAINLARGAARDKGLTLRSVVSPHVPAAVRGDPTRVRQILINLIGNAVKFTPSGEVSVSISVERDDGHALVLMFAISDTGIGVTPAARERLFEAFVQGDGSTTRRFGGTGLGLSISSRLVALMGGRIWLGEHEGPGSTFCFTARVERTSEIVMPVSLAAGALRVLVLDDDKATRRTFEATLAAWGMYNASAADVDSARSQLREAVLSRTPFDVVLIDYVLPQSDGLVFAAELARSPDYGSPASILITAFDAVGRKAAALAAGCAGYLPKPVDPSDLYEALGKIEREHKARIGGGDGKSRARILMAEDSALIRRVARLQLEELNYAVDIVEDGRQAVEAASTGNYELVLMDMRMPEMDGLEATRAIRKAERESGRHIVVVALTANVLDGDREACTAAGMDDFLAKPLKLDALRIVLKHWLPEALVPKPLITLN